MATALTIPFRGMRYGTALLLCTLAVAAPAENLPDPTRPPAELGAEPKSVSDELQSIIISPARRAAIINGQTVELGAKLGDVRLIEINASNVVLEGVQGRRVLTLFPDIKTNKDPRFLSMKNAAKNPAVRPGTDAGHEPGAEHAPQGEEK
jgi:MSHA biogenesis protein MshK